MRIRINTVVMVFVLLPAVFDRHILAMKKSFSYGQLPSEQRCKEGDKGEGQFYDIDSSDDSLSASCFLESSDQESSVNGDNQSDDDTSVDTLSSSALPMLKQLEKSDKLTNAEKENIKQIIKDIKGVNVPLTSGEISSLGVPDKTLKLYLKKVVKGGAIFGGLVILYATFNNPENLDCLQLACHQSQLVRTVLCSSLSLGITWAGISEFTDSFVDKLSSCGGWIKQCCLRKNNKKK